MQEKDMLKLVRKKGVKIFGSVLNLDQQVDFVGLVQCKFAFYNYLLLNGSWCCDEEWEEVSRLLAENRDILTKAPFINSDAVLRGSSSPLSEKAKRLHAKGKLTYRRLINLNPRALF